MKTVQNIILFVRDWRHYLYLLHDLTGDMHGPWLYNVCTTTALCLVDSGVILSCFRQHPHPYLFVLKHIFFSTLLQLFRTPFLEMLLTVLVWKRGTVFVSSLGLISHNMSFPDPSCPHHVSKKQATSVCMYTWALTTSSLYNMDGKLQALLTLLSAPAAVVQLSVLVLFCTTVVKLTKKVSSTTQQSYNE